jgi:hypothetical protein
MTLTVPKGNISNVFQLVGFDENSASFALGWVFEKSPAFRQIVVDAIFKRAVKIDDPLITLQKHADDGGYTDLELRFGGNYHIIMEAKHSWQPPTKTQLQRYLPRMVGSNRRNMRLVSISAADINYAKAKLPKELGGVKIVHMSWGMLKKLSVQVSKAKLPVVERAWLRHLVEHLKEYIWMERVSDNTVFVVSLGKQILSKGYTSVDMVEKDRRYSHPVGGRFPKDPPNYIGFRYNGKLQSIHHVDNHKIVTNLAKENRRWPATNSDRFVYFLGPPIRPSKDVRSGNIRDLRLRCAIDTLLSGEFGTIMEAYKATKLRLDNDV